MTWWTGLVARVSSVKLTLSQYALGTAALVIAGLAALLKFKEHELSSLRAQVLSTKFQYTQKQQDLAISTADQKVKDAEKQYQDALSHLSSFGGTPPKAS